MQTTPGGVRDLPRDRRSPSLAAARTSRSGCRSREWEITSCWSSIPDRRCWNAHPTSSRHTSFDVPRRTLLLARAPDRATIAALAKIGVVLSGARPVAEPRRATPSSPQSLQFALTHSSFPARDLGPFLRPEWAQRESEVALGRAQLRTVAVSPPAPRGVSAPHPTRRDLPPKAPLQLPKPIANAISVLRRAASQVVVARRLDRGA